MTPALRKALTVIKRCPGISSYRLAEHLGVTQPSAYRAIERLRSRGMVSGYRQGLRAV